MKKTLSILCAVTAALLLVNNLWRGFEEEMSQFAFDYLTDPLVIISVVLVALVNLRDSLRLRNATGNHLAQIPRDAITALEGILGFRYLLQYLGKMAPALEPIPNLWASLDSVIFVVLVFEAISLWRSAALTNREGQ